MENLLCSLFLIIVPAFASAVLLLRIRKNQLIISRLFFWNYGVGFLILSLVHLPIFFINLRIFTLHYSDLMILSGISFLALLISYLFFYRGTVLLLTRDRFITTVFPIFTLPFIAALAIFSLFVIKVGTLLMYTAIAWGFLLPNNTYLASLFLYFFIKGAPFDSLHRRPPALFLSLAWFIVLVTDIMLWLDAAVYNPELWILKLASLKGILIAKTFGYLLIFIGCLFYSRYAPQPKTEEKT